MPEMLTVFVNGQALRLPRGTVAAAALVLAGCVRFRSSVTGTPRAAICGMGICQECRVTINGFSHERSCLRLCEEGMEILTDE
jgi:aerobic-type carbon monoxide dehydrogenase small subunit (CoxS/CutS family)